MLKLLKKSFFSLDVSFVRITPNYSQFYHLANRRGSRLLRRMFLGLANNVLNRCGVVGALLLPFSNTCHRQYARAIKSKKKHNNLDADNFKMPQGDQL